MTGTTLSILVGIDFREGIHVLIHTGKLQYYISRIFVVYASIRSEGKCITQTICFSLFEYINWTTNTAADEILLCLSQPPSTHSL